MSSLLRPDVRERLHRLDAGRCITWRAEQLPGGCTPRRARVGVEHRSTGEVALLVESGVRYDGPHKVIREWLAGGGMVFDSMQELLAWADLWLESPGLPVAGGASVGSGVRAGDLTDLDAIQAHPSAESPRTVVDADTLQDRLGLHLVGQDRALRVLCRRVREHLAQSDPRRPLSLFAVGPTGVGKTATAAQLAAALREQTGGEWPHLRIDMNEYREPHRVSQLLGAPAGYVGHGDRTPLAGLLARETPSVLLFDEIDKAHSDVMTTLMAALDAGRLTLGDGVSADLRHSIIVFTSNAHASRICERVGSATTDGEIDTFCRAELLRAGVWPELVGRMRSYLLFEPLSPSAQAEIAVLTIARAAESFGLRVVHVDPDVVSALLGHTSDLGLGVRRLEYDVMDLLGDALITYLGSHEVGDVIVSDQAGAPVLKPAELSEPQAAPASSMGEVVLESDDGTMP